LASAAKKTDPTVPIIVVLAALLALILFGGNCNGIPRFSFDTGSSNPPTNPGPGPGDRGYGRRPGDRGGPPGDRGLRRDLRGCAGPGPDRCHRLENRRRGDLHDRGHRAHGRGIHGRGAAGDHTERRRTHRRDRADGDDRGSAWDRGAEAHPASGR
jgi:hypothetical protein